MIGGQKLVKIKYEIFIGTKIYLTTFTLSLSIFIYFGKIYIYISHIRNSNFFNKNLKKKNLK
jgi:hypothetical protein